MSNTKRIWDSFKHTDPQFTKQFNKFGKDLTTTDPMYQVMKMTDQFGPVGEGWTYNVEYTYTEKCVFAELKIGWREDTNKDFNWYGPVSAVNPLYNTKGTLDDEAPKKAMTDAMTKAMSHLGMAADVFLGLYDSNKYVQQMRAKFATANESKVKELKIAK
tara:strand:+ start:111 stop:590 length:480 start_codon:yes stop_codon:yes gene_type:complete